MLALGMGVWLVSMHACVHALIWGHGQIHPEDGFSMVRTCVAQVDMFGTRPHYAALQCSGIHQPQGPGTTLA